MSKGTNPSYESILSFLVYELHCNELVMDSTKFIHSIENWSRLLGSDEVRLIDLYLAYHHTTLCMDINGLFNHTCTLRIFLYFKRSNILKLY